MFHHLIIILNIINLNILAILTYYYQLLFILLLLINILLS